MLLHYGGLELQDVFHTLPDADSTEEGGNPYKKATYILSTHFKPKLNVMYERHVFRQLKQNEGDKMNQYIMRLRQQAKNCEFQAEDMEICGQIVEKCVSNKLRRLLEEEDFKLEDVMKIVRTIEAIDLQTKDIINKTIATTHSVRKGRKNEKKAKKNKDA